MVFFRPGAIVTLFGGILFSSLTASLQRILAKMVLRLLFEFGIF